MVTWLTRGQAPRGARVDNLASPGADAVSDPLDPQIRDRLARGEVLIDTAPIPGTGHQRIHVRAVIDAPPATVWRHIEQALRYPEFMPRIKKTEELERSPDHVRTRTTVELPFPLKNLTATTRAKHIVEPGVRYVREWKLEEGDYHVNEGSWTLTPFDGNAQRTFADYQTYVVPKIPIPKALQASAQEKQLPKMIEAIRERCKKHP